MGIGYVGIKDKPIDSYTGCTVSDTAGGCSIEMWDNSTNHRTYLSMSVTTCVELRNFLNLYIESYANNIDEEDQ